MLVFQNNFCHHSVHYSTDTIHTMLTLTTFAAGKRGQWLAHLSASMLAHSVWPALASLGLQDIFYLASTVTVECEAQCKRTCLCAGEPGAGSDCQSWVIAVHAWPSNTVASYSAGRSNYLLLWQALPRYFCTVLFPPCFTFGVANFFQSEPVEKRVKW